MRKQFAGKYYDVVSPENLFAAWQEFVKNKRGKRDVQEFAFRLSDNILQLHQELANFSYSHGGYKAFNISDPKPRHIHKATVRDRVLHHAVYRQLYPFFDKTFIADSFSCRLGKGAHKALNRFRALAYKVSKNNTRTVWLLKCDIKKFFASIDHAILLDILAAYIPDGQILRLMEKVIGSFATQPAKGLPLGNLTSQLFCNIYMNEFDQFVKHKLSARYYIRYADDFIFLSESRNWLASLIPQVSTFLEDRLCLALHPKKIFLKTLASGVDFLGWVHFPYHRVLRATTRMRMFRRISVHPTNVALQSYLGLLNHGNTFRLKQKMLNSYGLWTGSGRN